MEPKLPRASEDAFPLPLLPMVYPKKLPMHKPAPLSGQPTELFDLNIIILSTYLAWLYPHLTQLTQCTIHMRY
jgi:hypothetical protein